MSRSAAEDRMGVAWQRGSWDRYPDIYQREVDQRFAPVVEQVLRRARLMPGQHVLDLGTGTGAAALRAATLVAPHGDAVAVDLSPAMLRVAQQRAEALGVRNLHCREGRAEAIPVDDGACEQLQLSLRRNLLPVKRIYWLLLMRHEHAARALVELMQIGKTPSGADPVLHHPPEPFDGIRYHLEVRMSTC